MFDIWTRQQSKKCSVKNILSAFIDKSYSNKINDHLQDT